MHPDLTGKPFPRRERGLPVLSGPCVLCLLAGEIPDANGYITDGEVRPLVEINGELTLTIENRWSHFGEDSRADLIISRRHTTCLEDLTAPEAEEFFDQILTTLDSHLEHDARTLAFINVGLAAGSSQPHFHGQVIRTAIHSANAIPLHLGPQDLARDQDLATQHGLFITNETATIYVPWAPSAPGEVRVIADDTPALAVALQDVLRRLSATFGEMPYNVAIHKSHRLVAQVLPRFNVGTMLPTYFGLTSNVISPEAIAEALRRR